MDEMRSKTSVPAIQTLYTRLYMVYRWRCRWNDNKKNYLIFVLLLLLITGSIFEALFASSEKNHQICDIQPQQWQQHNTCFSMWIFCSECNNHKKMAFIYYKFIAHRYSAPKTNGRLRSGVLRREWMKLNLYNKNWIGRWPATQRKNENTLKCCCCCWWWFMCIEQKICRAHLTKMLITMNAIILYIN